MMPDWDFTLDDCEDLECEPFWLARAVPLAAANNRVSDSDRASTRHVTVEGARSDERDIGVTLPNPRFPSNIGKASIGG
jgi:hypothetical protein